jgi:Zn-dependent protease with chaperone function
LLLASYGTDLAAGCLTWLRVTVGDWILLDEVLLLTPTIGTQLLFWRVYYPVDRKLREAVAFNAIDSGEPVAPIWTARQYLLSQIRHSLLIPGVPLLILLAWTETLNMTPDDYLTLPNGYDLQTPLSLLGTGMVFLLTPVMIRNLWDTQALPVSPMRSRLLELCKQYRVGVREILYWKTFGGMANGAVIGFVGPLRYILLTDVLLSRMTPSCVEAVMAHEIAHVKKKHMFWMIAGAGAMMVIFELTFGLVTWLVGMKIAGFLGNSKSIKDAIDNIGLVISLICAGVCWLLCFGWMSRRMERQADSFAVAHMAKTHGHQRIEPEDAYAMIQALEEVAILNHVRPEKKSWRHGSIRWRQNYLKELVTFKPSQLPIDRTMRWLCLLIFVSALLSAWLLWGGIDQIQDYLTPVEPVKVYII